MLVKKLALSVAWILPAVWIGMVSCILMMGYYLITGIGVLIFEIRKR